MWVLLPVKDLRTGKSRLASSLPEHARQSLMAALLADLLGCLQQCETIKGVLVVTRCPTATALAKHHGAETLSTPDDTGLNEAVKVGIETLTRLGIRAAMVMHADLPMATTSDIDTLVHLHQDSASVVSLVPDNRQDGTNAMLLDLPTAMSFAYGSGSYPAHLALAKAANLAVQTLHNPHIGSDIDLWDDFQPLFSLSSNTRQRGHLTHWLEQYGELFEWPQAANH